MENKQETKKDLDFDQLEQVTGGADGSDRTVQTCKVCGAKFYLRKPGQMAAFQAHIKTCRPDSVSC